MATPQPDRAMWDRLLADISPGDLQRAGIYRDDVTGAPYSLKPGGARSYISPAAFRTVRAEDMDPRQAVVPPNPNVPADTTGMFREEPQWNTRTGQWDTPVDWGNIVTLATAGGLTAGAVNAALAGGAPAASGGSPAAAGGPTATPITSAGMEAAMPGSMVAAPAAPAAAPSVLPSRPTVPPSGSTPQGGPGMRPDGTLFSDWRTWLDAVGPILSGAAKGQAEGRRADAEINARAIAENNRAKVEAARYNRDLPSVRASQTARGEVLNTMQDAPMTGDSRIDKFSGGGLRPSAFGPQSRQAGAELSRQALSRLMNPEADRFTPQEIPESKGGTVENIAAGVGIGANIFSLLPKYGRRNGGR